MYLRGGGREVFPGPPDGTGTYPAHYRTRAPLVQVSADPIRYERRLPDGSLEVYALPDTAPAGERRVFLTEVRDPQGQSVTLTHDAEYRLIAVTDAEDAPTLWTYRYDRADQLTSAVHQTTGGTPSIIKRYAYTYDPAGNRTSEQIDDSVMLARRPQPPARTSARRAAHESRREYRRAVNVSRPTRRFGRPLPTYLHDTGDFERARGHCRERR